MKQLLHHMIEAKIRDKLLINGEEWKVVNIEKRSRERKKLAKTTIVEDMRKRGSELLPSSNPKEEKLDTN